VTSEVKGYALKRRGRIRKLTLLLGLISLVATTQIAAQTKVSRQEKATQEEPVQGLFNTDRSKVDCNSIEDDAHNDLLNLQTPILMGQLTSVYQLDSVNPPVTYDFVKGDKTAYAVLIGACGKEYRGKGKKLVLIGEDIFSEKQTDLEKKLTLVAVLAHEMAHFKQQALQIKLVDKEVELHADYMAGWFLAQYVSKLNLPRDEKLRSVITALSMFYFFGQDEKPSVTYGTPENRLQISLDGYQDKTLDANLVYSKGIEIINRNPIYQNLPDEVGTKIKGSLSNVTGKEDSIRLFNTTCSPRVLISDNTSVERNFSCRIHVPINLDSDKTYQTSDELYNAINKGFISYLPKNTRKIPGSDNTSFNVQDLSFPIRAVFVTKLNQEVAVGVNFGIPSYSLPIKNETSPKNAEAVEIENQIFDLAKKSRAQDIRMASIGGTDCIVSLKHDIDGTQVIACKYALTSFEKLQGILFSLIPKGFRFLKTADALLAWNNKGEDKNYYSKRYSSHSPITYISLTKIDYQIPEKAKLAIGLISGATIGKIVAEKRIMNSVGQEFDQKTRLMSRSETMPSFTFRQTPCNVDEVDKYSWVVECQIKPDAKKNESIDNIFTEIRGGLASWAPVGWEEDESEEYYNLKQPEQFTDIPTALEIGVRKTKSFVQLQFYVNEKNSKVKFGSNNPKPNDLGNEILTQLNNLINLDINVNSSFQLFGQNCQVEYVPERMGNHVTCMLLGSEESNLKVFNRLKEAVISILPKNWKYRIEGKSFDAERIFGFKCPTKSGSQNLMCYAIGIYFSIGESGSVLFNIDFENDETRLSKP
jgi:hypothetical protein